MREVPPEVLDHIFSHLIDICGGMHSPISSTRTLAACCRVSKAFLNPSTEALYRTINLEVAVTLSEIPRENEQTLLVTPHETPRTLRLVAYPPQLIHRLLTTPSLARHVRRFQFPPQGLRLRGEVWPADSALSAEEWDRVDAISEDADAGLTLGQLLAKLIRACPGARTVRIRTPDSWSLLAVRHALLETSGQITRLDVEELNFGLNLHADSPFDQMMDAVSDITSLSLPATTPTSFTVAEGRKAPTLSYLELMDVHEDSFHRVTASSHASLLRLDYLIGFPHELDL